MTIAVEYLMNTAAAADIAEHLLRCDGEFVAILTSRVRLLVYAKKVAAKATTFEAWSGGKLVGLVAAYCNNHENTIAYITNVSVLKEWNGYGIAKRLLKQCIDHANASGMHRISLEVASDNSAAIQLYEKNGFAVAEANATSVGMNLYLKVRRQV